MRQLKSVRDVEYHLSFLAVSVAMLGMAAGAVFVFLGDAVLQGTRSRVTLARYATILAVAIPCSHLVNLCIPIPMLRILNPSMSDAATSPPPPGMATSICDGEPCRDTLSRDYLKAQGVKTPILEFGPDAQLGVVV